MRRSKSPRCVPSSGGGSSTCGSSRARRTWSRARSIARSAGCTARISPIRRRSSPRASPCSRRARSSATRATTTTPITCAASPHAECSASGSAPKSCATASRRPSPMPVARSGCRCSRCRIAPRSSPWRARTARRSPRSRTRGAAGRSPRSAPSRSPRSGPTGSGRRSPNSPGSSTPGSACSMRPERSAASTPPAPSRPDVLDGITAEAGAVLRRGARAGSSLRLGDTPFSLQTLGRGGHLRGVIAIATGDLDQEGRTVVTSVVAMAGLALEQQQSLARAHGLLRAGLVQSLMTGDPALARRISRELWNGFPAAPVRVAMTDAATARSDAVAEWLAVRATERKGGVFFGRTEDGLLLVARRRGCLRRARGAVRRLRRHLRADVVRGLRPGARPGHHRPAPRNRGRSRGSPRSRHPESSPPSTRMPLARSRVPDSPRCASTTRPTARRSSRPCGCGSSRMRGSTRRPRRSECTGTPCARGSGSPRPCSAPISRRSRPAPTSGRPCRSRRTTQVAELPPGR